MTRQHAPRAGLRLPHDVAGPAPRPEARAAARPGERSLLHRYAEVAVTPAAAVTPAVQRLCEGCRDEAAED